MKDTPPTTTPITLNPVRLGGCHREFLENLPSLGPIFLQARNAGGGLGKHVSSCQPLLVPHMSYAVDPDAGLAVSLDELIAVHLIVSDSEPHPSPSLDIEFCNFPAGLSLIEIPGLSQPGCIQKYAAPFGGNSLSFDELEAWRVEIAPPAEMCQTCEKAGEQRADNPQTHPLYQIFEQARVKETELNVRLIGEHVDLTSTFVPSSVYPVSGYTIVSDSTGSSVLHLNLKMVHAFQLRTRQIDGIQHSCISVFDMHGNHNFEISSEGIEPLRNWRAVTNRHNTRYQKRKD